MNMNSNIPDNEFYEEINYIYFFNIIWRNKKLIILFLVSFLIFSSIYTKLIKKKIWEGRFEIVLGSNQDEKNFNPLKQLALGIGDSESALKTEVGILKSPSVLLPVFNYVNKEYKHNNPKKTELNFSAWRENNLNITLQKNTSILTILYSDKNREIIIPVLKKISSEYKSYSGKNKRRNLKLAEDYLIEQISIYKGKSAYSLKTAQQYAINQDLIISNKSLDENIVKFENKNDSNIEISPYLIKSNIGIEGVRVRAANEIRNIDNQIKKIEFLNEDFKQLQYLGATINGLIETGLPEQLETIESKLVDLRSIYTDKDIKIIRLIERRKLLIKLLKERAIGYLKAERLKQEALMESATRPKDVLLKYKELMREAGRDETTLISLENNLRKINLERARLEDPWELINQPTLNVKPKGVSDKKFIFLFTTFGTLIGYIFSLIKEKTSGILYEDELISKEFNVEIIEKINIRKKKFEYYDIDILTKEIFKESETNYPSFIASGNIDKSTLKTIKSLFKQISNFEIEEDFSKISSQSKIIVFAINGEINKKQIYQTLNRLEIQNKEIFGIILINK